MNTRTHLAVISTVSFIAESALLGAQPAHAQQPGEQARSVEEIVITGSRIRQNPLEERLPVMSLGTEDYRASGATSLADFVQKLPISGSAINRTNNSSGNLGYPPDGGGIGAGAAEIDLRYLASKRVLVLVDGRRWIKGSSGSGVSGAVDLNSIPVNAIQSIEILQDGASAIYGTDAIGGVLNVITSNDYESLKISGSAGSYDEGDGETAEFDVRFGGEGERGRALIDISYVDQKEVNTQDRETSIFPLPGYQFGVSSGIPPGRFRFCDTRTGCDPTDPESPRSNVVPNAGVPTPVWNPTDQDNDDSMISNPDLFNYQPFNHLVTPNERVSVFGKAEYDIADEVTFRVLTSFNNRKSQGRAAPVPLFFGPDGGSTPYMVNVFWPANHPFNPFGIDLWQRGTTISPLSPAGRSRPGRESSTRTSTPGTCQRVSTASSSSLSGACSGTSRESGRRTTRRRPSSISSTPAHLNVAMGDPDVCAATPGCVPLDLVGEGSMTPEMLEFVTYTGVDTSSQELTDFTANLTGDLFDLPAGPLGFAIGVEHREEDGSFAPDPVVAAGETADVPANPTTGGFDVDEYYGEVVVPMLKDLPLADIAHIQCGDPLLGFESVLQRNRQQARIELGADREPDAARQLLGGVPRAEHRRAVQPGCAFRSRTSPIVAPMCSRRMRPTARPWACRRTSFSSTRRYPWTRAVTRSWCPRRPIRSPPASPGTRRWAAWEVWSAC